MVPKQSTRSTTDQETTNTTSVTNAQLQAMIDQGVTAALAACDALRRGLLDMIHGSVVASKPKIMQEEVAITTELMD
nr:hypothetical protein [Tanacetum cinerariifolium]